MRSYELGYGFHFFDYIVIKESKIHCMVSGCISDGQPKISLMPLKCSDDIGNGCGMALWLKDVEELNNISIKIERD